MGNIEKIIKGLEIIKETEGVNAKVDLDDLILYVGNTENYTDQQKQELAKLGFCVNSFVGMFDLDLCD